VKLQKISEIQQSLPLTEFDFIKKYRESFLKSNLGRIKQILPLKELAESIAKKMPKRKPQGCKRMFPLEGEIALMFLKSTLCLILRVLLVINLGMSIRKMISIL
jgi:hypothetical protein